jgi:hypothetical protein
MTAQGRYEKGGGMLGDDVKFCRKGDRFFNLRRRWEMEGKIRVVLVMVLAVGLLAAYVPATGLAEGIKTEFSGTECFLEQLADGTSTPLGNGAVHIVGMLQRGRDDTDDPRTTGDVYAEINLILDPSTGWGPAWGTFEIVNEMGTWSGNWSGRLDGWTLSMRAVGHGSGAYEGLVGYWDYFRPGPVPCYGLSGYIVETGAGR